MSYNTLNWSINARISCSEARRDSQQGLARETNDDVLMWILNKMRCVEETRFFDWMSPDLYVRPTCHVWYTFYSDVTWKSDTQFSSKITSLLEREAKKLGEPRRFCLGRTGTVVSSGTVIESKNPVTTVDATMNNSN